MIAADLPHRRHAPRADCARNHAHGAQQIESTALEVLAGDVFQGLPARPQIDAVADFRVARDGANSFVQKMRDQVRDGIAGDDRVSVHANKNGFVFGQMLQRKVEGIGFAAVGFGQNQQTPGSGLKGRGVAGKFQCSICRTIVDDNDAQVGVVGVERGKNRALNDLLFVEGGNQQGDPGTKRGHLFRRTEAAPKHAVDDGQQPHEEQPSGHEDIADEKYRRYGFHDQFAEGESEPVNSGGPEFARRQRRHDFRARLSQQLTDGHDLQAAGANAVDNQRQSIQRCPAVASAVMQQQNAATTEIVRGARRQVLKDFLGDFLRRAGRVCTPVVRVNAVTHRDVAEALRDLERTNLVGGIRLLVNRVRRAEQHGLDADPAGEQTLRQVQFQLHQLGRNDANVRVGKGVVANLVAFPVYALDDRREFLRFEADNKERGFDVAIPQKIENPGRPFRIRAIVKGNGYLLRVGPVARHTVG